MTSGAWTEEVAHAVNRAPGMRRDPAGAACVKSDLDGGREVTDSAVERRLGPGEASSHAAVGRKPCRALSEEPGGQATNLTGLGHWGPGQAHRGPTGPHNFNREENQ